MKLRCFGSGSSGNSYSLTSKTGQTIIIDAGVRTKEIFKAYNPSSIIALLVSHSHGDHAKYIESYLKKYVKVYLPYQYGMQAKYSSLINNAEHFQQVTAGEFMIMPFDLNHDVRCVGYFINHPELDHPLMYATDTNGIPYMMDPMSVAMIEADYDTEILKANYDDKKISRTRVERVIHTHMSIEQATHFALTQCKDASCIILLHLSKDNADKELFKAQMEKATGKQVYIAQAGFELELCKEDIFDEST